MAMGAWEGERRRQGRRGLCKGHAEGSSKVWPGTGKHLHSASGQPSDATWQRPHASMGMLRKAVESDFTPCKRAAVLNTTSVADVCRLNCVAKDSQTDFRGFCKANEVNLGIVRENNQKSKARVTAASISRCKHQQDTRDKNTVM